MEINRKGFAITGILYTILVLFLLLLSSLLAILSTRVNRLSSISADISSEIEYKKEMTSSENIVNVGSNYYITNYRGKYEIIINGDANKKCYSYLPNNTLLKINGGKIQYKVYPNDSQCRIDTNNITGLKDLEMFDCDNSNVSSISFNYLNTSQEKEGTTTQQTETNPSYNTLSKLGLTDILRTGTPNFSNIATTDEGIYAAADDLGTSYYFRGASTRNYVKLGKYKKDIVLGQVDHYNGREYWYSELKLYNNYTECREEDNKNVEVKITCSLKNWVGQDILWRIIRINGDGTIRLVSNNVIFPGYVEFAPSAIAIYSSSFAYKHPFSGEIQQTTVVDMLNTWYEYYFDSNITGKYLTDAIFCNDRVEKQTYIDSDSDRFGSGVILEYAPAQRLRNKTPTLKCSTFSDRNTINAYSGNGYLKYPIGLITADEAMFAGATVGVNEYGQFFSVANTKYYLYSGSPYWTMSPVNSYSTFSYIFSIGGDGGIGGELSYSDFAIKPVINLRSDILLDGIGTKEDPFIVSGIDIEEPLPICD